MTIVMGMQLACQIYPRSGDRSRRASDAQVLPAELDENSTWSGFAIAPYPTKPEIRNTFAPVSRANGKDFFIHVAEDVDWTVTGHHPLAGRYTRKQASINGTVQQLSGIMKEPLKLAPENVVGGGQESHAVVELKAVAVYKNGLNFDNRYAWVLKFDEAKKMVQVHAYLDSELLKRALEENE
ncbi:hypothetical protein DFH09DRAFT_1091318 [Mycena vulgaris]|nr:hypothetical protein DFH09DRAFT_1091318 [Mycena vulgaris]